MAVLPVDHDGPGGGGAYLTRFHVRCSYARIPSEGCRQLCRAGHIPDIWYRYDTWHRPLPGRLGEERTPGGAAGQHHYVSYDVLERYIFPPVPHAALAAEYHHLHAADTGD